MYTISQALDRTFMACPVAPPCDKTLDPSVRELSVAHFIIAGRRPFEPFAQAIAGLNDEQIDRGRLQWLHTVQQIRDTLNHHRFASDEQAPHRRSLPQLVMLLAQHVVHDVDALAAQCQKTPGQAKALSAWAQALGVLAQALVVAQTMRTVSASSREASKDMADWEDLVQRLDAQFQERASGCVAFHHRVGPAYDEVRTALNGVSPDTLMAQAREDVLTQATAPMDLTMGRMQPILDRLGSRDHLWVIVQNSKKRDQAIAAQHYVPLNHADAAVVRDGMVNLLRSFDAYQHSGLLSALRAIGQEQAYCGETSQMYVDQRTDEADLREDHRRACANPYRRQNEKPTEKDLKNRLAKLPQARRDQRLEAVARLDLASRIALAAQAIAATLNGQPAVSGSVMTLEDQGNGISVGRWNDDASRVLLVYPDSTVSIEDALYTMVVPSGVLDDGLPVFSEDLKARAQQECWTGTNHHSVAEFMREMNDEATQRWLAGHPFTVLHGNPAAPSKHTYPAPHRAGL